MSVVPSIMSEILKPSENPPWRITRQAIATNEDCICYDSDEGRLFKGRYPGSCLVTGLREDGHGVWMSDTPFEYEGVKKHVEKAHGNVLTSGLGLGLFVVLAMIKDNVEKVDIVEREQKVIDLVFSQISVISGGKCEAICDDLYHFLETTDRQYDYIYLDIWPDHFGPIEDVDKAVAAAQRCLSNDGQVGFWLQELVERVKDKIPTSPVECTGLLCTDPCLVCGKTFRYDFAGLCMDCADMLRVSNLFIEDGA